MVKVFFWYSLCFGLLIIVILLCLKVYLLKKSIYEICTGLKEHLSTDTNTLLSISSGDKHIRQLASELNKQLSLLRNQRQRYFNGNTELNTAVTNISHDLRTPLTAINGYLDLLDKEEKSQEVNRYITIIKNRIETMKQLTEELFRP